MGLPKELWCSDLISTELDILYWFWMNDSAKELNDDVSCTLGLICTGESVRSDVVALRK